MAKLAEYKFTDYEGYIAAYNRLPSTGINGSSYGSYYYISIYDDCAEPKEAGQICRANGGEACN